MTGTAQAETIRQLYRAGRFDAAVAELKVVLAGRDTDAATWSMLGDVLFEMGRYEDARSSYSRAFRLTPTAYVVERVAFCQEALGQREEARNLMGRVGHTYVVEISGSCNLRCPSCPNGNSRAAIPGRQAMQRLMDLEVYRRIIQRISQPPWRASCVILYNWGEPLLHPQVGEMIKIARSAGIGASISTNLNAVKHLESVVRARPVHLKVSLSGISEETYGIGHAGGKAATVVSNLHLLRELIDAHAPGLKVEVGFHVYRHNIHEVPAVKELAAGLGFDLSPGIAYFCPHERILDIVEQGQVRAEDQAILERLVVDIDDLIAFGRQHRMPVCTTQLRQTVINADGSLGLCCSVYDAQYNVAPDFLALAPQDVQRLKAEHSFCAACMADGLHVSFGGSYTEFISAERERLNSQAMASLGGSDP